MWISNILALAFVGLQISPAQCIQMVEQRRQQSFELSLRNAVGDVGKDKPPTPAAYDTANPVRLNATVKRDTECKNCPYGGCLNSGVMWSGTVAPFQCWTQGEPVGDKRSWLRYQYGVRQDEFCYITTYDLNQSGGDYAADLPYCGTKSELMFYLPTQKVKTIYYTECSLCPYRECEGVNFYQPGVSLTVNCQVTDGWMQVGPLHPQGTSKYYRTPDNCYVSVNTVEEILKKTTINPAPPPPPGAVPAAAPPTPPQKPQEILPPCGPIPLLKPSNRPPASPVMSVKPSSPPKPITGFPPKPVSSTTSRVPQVSSSSRSSSSTAPPKVPSSTTLPKAMTSIPSAPKSVPPPTPNTPMSLNSSSSALPKATTTPLLSNTLVPPKVSNTSAAAVTLSSAHLSSSIFTSSQASRSTTSTIPAVSPANILPSSSSSLSQPKPSSVPTVPVAVPVPPKSASTSASSTTTNVMIPPPKPLSTQPSISLPLTPPTAAPNYSSTTTHTSVVIVIPVPLSAPSVVAPKSSSSATLAPLSSPLLQPSPSSNRPTSASPSSLPATAIPVPPKSLTSSSSTTAITNTISPKIPSSFPSSLVSSPVAPKPLTSTPQTLQSPQTSKPTESPKASPQTWPPPRPSQVAPVPQSWPPKPPSASPRPWSSWPPKGQPPGGEEEEDEEEEPEETIATVTRAVAPCRRCANTSCGSVRRFFRRHKERVECAENIFLKSVKSCYLKRTDTDLSAEDVEELPKCQHRN